MPTERVQRTVIRNLALARDVVGSLAVQAMNAFAPRILRMCRGNLEDINQGAVFNQFMQQHGIRDEQIDIVITECMCVQPGEYQWINQLLGGDYANSMTDPPLFRPSEQGESSGVGEARASTSQDPLSQVVNVTLVRPTPRVDRPRRMVRPPEPYIHTQYLEQIRRAGRGGH